MDRKRQRSTVSSSSGPTAVDRPDHGLEVRPVTKRPRTDLSQQEASRLSSQSEHSKVASVRLIVPGPLDDLRQRVLTEISLGCVTSQAEIALQRAKCSDDVANILSETGMWSPNLLNIFSAQPVRHVSLSSSISTAARPCSFLKEFFKFDSFIILSSLTLRGIQLSHLDLSLLRLLPAMTKLDISSTNVTNRHLLHLVTHAPALKSLNISSNISITDDARMPVAALTKLSSLHLGGTAFTIPGLRLLVYALPPSCELATIPQGCLAYLNDRGQQYAVAIPPGYAQDPRQVPGLTIPALRRNLALHRSCNKRVQIAGNRIELIERLRSILCGRVADRKLANSMCQSRNSNPESMLGNVLRTGKPLENF